MQSEMMYQKEGFSPNDVGAVLTLIVGVAVATLVLIFTGALGGQTYQLVETDLNEIGNQSATAVSFTGSNTTAVYLGHAPIHENTLVIYNGTHTLSAGNVTADLDAGTVLVGSAFDGKSLYANFSYGDLDIQGYVKDAITSGFKAQKTTGTYLPLIVLAAVIGIVLTMVLGLGGLGGRPGYGSAL